jgi:hypothetical protein
MEKVSINLWINYNQVKKKYIDSGKEKQFKTKNKIGHMKIKNYKFERVENFKYLEVILHEDNNHQIHLQE